MVRGKVVERAEEGNQEGLGCWGEGFELGGAFT